MNNEEGPTAVEYAVMLALIVVVCLAAISVLGNNASDKFAEVANTSASVHSSVNRELTVSSETATQFIQASTEN